jgi:hypothetical protein
LPAPVTACLVALGVNSRISRPNWQRVIPSTLCAYHEQSSKTLRSFSLRKVRSCILRIMI